MSSTGANLTYLGYWEVLEKFTDIQTSLYTFDNMNKWMKSSRLNRFDSGTHIVRQLRQGETMELLSEDVGYSNSQEDWVTLAINNQLIEEEYTPEGGKIISVVFQNNSNFAIDNIIDSLVGKNVLGKDINRKIAFIDDDMETVEYEKSNRAMFIYHFRNSKRKYSRI